MPLLTGVTGFKPITVKDLLMVKGSGMIPGIATMIPDKPEIIYQPLYDRVNYPQVGIANINFFATVRGQTAAALITGGAAAARVKTLRDTNMDQVNVMSAKGFIMYGVAIGYVPLGCGVAVAALQNFADDIYRIASGGFLEIKFIDKPYVQLPLLMIPSPFSFHNSHMATTGNNLTMGGPGGMGDGMPTRPFVFDPPYLIAPNENFTISATLDGTALTAGNTIDIVIALMGYMLRPAQ